MSSLESVAAESAKLPNDDVITSQPLETVAKPTEVSLARSETAPDKSIETPAAPVVEPAIEVVKSEDTVAAPVEKVAFYPEGPIEENPNVVWYNQDGFEYSANGIFCAGEADRLSAAKRKIAMSCSDGTSASLKVNAISATEGSGQISMSETATRSVTILTR